MKKYQKAAIIFFIISVVLYFGYNGYEKINTDKVPPVITAPEGVLKISVEAKEKDLLKGVKAVDAVSGDVTDTIVIESISPFTESNTRIITYAAIDGSQNIGRLERTMEYTDYERPRFELSGPLRVPSGISSPILKNVHAYSNLDGDISSRVKYTYSEYFNTTHVGACTVEFRVMDSAGTVEYLPAIVEVYDERVERIEVNLTDYLVYIDKGDEFTAEKYFKNSSTEGKLDIISNVDTDKPGIYLVDYIVSADSNVGKTNLIVIVTENEVDN